MRHICTLCDYIYSERDGLPEAGIEPGTRLEELPEGWSCPSCAGGKEYFLTCSCVSLALYETTRVKTAV